MADPMGDEAAYVLAAHLQHGIEGHGHEEILLLVPDRDDTTMATANNKRTAADAMLEQEVTYEEDDSRKKRRGSPPQKKLNNEQWDAMFARLVEYKRLNGVSGIARKNSFIMLVDGIVSKLLGCD